MFAFKSTLLKGAILADEVGLGKPLKLVSCFHSFEQSESGSFSSYPANLRKQWRQELQEKFFLDNMVMMEKMVNLNGYGKSRLYNIAD